MVVNVTWRRALAAVAAVAVLGLAVAWSGVISVGASTGHWAITDWFLHWAMRSSVRTHAALMVKGPAIDPTGLVSAAGHFAAHCGICHGAPGEPPPPVMQASTPAAPDLRLTAGTWSDAELFWIVKHGVKLTPMPAWPSLERDDEVRRMVAFVRRLPDMPPEEYRRLAFGEGQVAGGAHLSPDDALRDCERCHADHGRAQPDVPVLAGQKPEYLARALADYASGRRASGVMQAAAARLAPDLREALAARYADATGGLRRARLADAPASAEEDRRAARIVTEGVPALDLPACTSCHAEGKRADYPRLAAQKATYMAARLRRWRGDPNVVDARKDNLTMPMIARRIPEDMIEPLARYFERQ